MKFWDTSALIPLIFVEEHSRAMRHLMFSDANIVVSFVTGVELASAVSRRLRDYPDRQRDAAEFAGMLEQSWTEIDPAVETLALAQRLAFVRGLRAGDAIQLACAISALDGRGRMPFVTLDQNLAAAARAEGFPILPDRISVL